MSFGLAWVTSSETTFNASHQRYDENVFAFQIDHREGECATLSLTIRNPRVGVLSASRKVWIWLSYNDGTSWTPLFFGRLVGVPNMQGSASGFAETVELIFIAKPIDFYAQRRALAESMAALPYYDPLFIDEDLRINTTAGTGDVNTVLEAYAARWHISRGEDGQPLVVSASDVNVGEDGTEVFESMTGSPACIDPASFSLTILGGPLNSCTVKASVPWKQDMTDAPAIDLGHWSILTYTGGALLSSWPKPGGSIAGGWAAAQSTAFDIFNAENATTSQWHLNWQNKAKQHTTGDSMSLNISQTDVVVHGPYISELLTMNTQAGVVWQSGDWGNAMGDQTLPKVDTTEWSVFAGDDQLTGDDAESDTINIPLHHDSSWGVVPLSNIQLSLSITFDAGADRNEGLNFTLPADVQPILVDPDDFDTSGDAVPPDEVILQLNGADVTVAIDGISPLPDAKSSTYWHTERGKQSTEYAILRARALLLQGARVVECTFGIPFERALNLTCRKNVLLNWAKLPGGYASGKVTAYSISASEGQRRGSVTIGCTVGRGFSTGTLYDAVTGVGELVEPGGLEPGIQQMVGQVIPIGPTSDVAWSPALMGLDSFGNPFPLTKDDVVVSERIVGSVEAQASAIRGALQLAHWASLPSPYTSSTKTDTKKQNASTLAGQLVTQAIKDNPLYLEIELRSTNDLAFADTVLPTLQPLLIPKTIDMEDPVTT